MLLNEISKDALLTEDLHIFGANGSIDARIYNLM